MKKILSLTALTLKLITRLRLGVSHLQDHEFRHSFQDCLNLICSCGIKVETTVDYLPHCLNNLHERNFRQHQVYPS